MKKISIAIFLMLVMTTFLTLSVSSEIGTHYTTDLIAAQTTDIGEVEYWYDEGQFHVKFIITESDWTLTQTHVHIADTPDDFPMTKKGNPKIGNFDFRNEHDFITEYTYHITWPNPDDNEYIAAHVVVTKPGGLEGLQLMLPDTVSMQIPILGGDLAYFPQVIITNGGDLNGTYPGWCIDTDHGISIGTTYDNVDVYSSYDELPEGIVEYPENLDLVNWVLNQDFIGKQSSTCGGTYTMGNVQRAIWKLVEDDWPEDNSGPESQCRTDEIVEKAYIYGEGFEPGCGDRIAIILDPGDDQTIIIEIDMPCEDDETAWGDGLNFPGDSWAMYIHWQST